MENFSQIQSDIKKYIISSGKSDLPERFIEVTIKKIGGLSNTNYVALVKDMTTNIKIDKVLYRRYGALSESVNHKFEADMMKYLASQGLGPHLYYEDPNNKYRLVEFLDDAFTIEREQTFNNELMQKMCPILNSYTLFSYTYKYKIQDRKVFLTKIDDGIKEKRIELSKNQYENCVVDWHKQAEKIFGKFCKQFEENVNRETNSKDYEDLALVKQCFDNYQQYFEQNYPLEGFMILCHNDIHRLNMLLGKKDKKLYLLDHEYAFLNIPGNDIANYVNESYFNYEPEYYCLLDKVDFDEIFGYYSAFINIFIESHKFIETVEGGKEFIKKIRTKKYFIQVMNIVNLYWFIWSLCYVDFDTWKKDHHGEYYFVHALDRYKMFLIGMKAIEKENE